MPGRRRQGSSTGGTGSGVGTLQLAYNAGVAGPQVVAFDSTRLGVIFRDASPGLSSGLPLFGVQDNSGANIFFQIWGDSATGNPGQSRIRGGKGSFSGGGNGHGGATLLRGGTGADGTNAVMGGQGGTAVLLGGFAGTNGGFGGNIGGVASVAGGLGAAANGTSGGTSGGYAVLAGGPGGASSATGAAGGGGNAFLVGGNAGDNSLTGGNNSSGVVAIDGCTHATIPSAIFIGTNYNGGGAGVGNTSAINIGVAGITTAIVGTLTQINGAYSLNGNGSSTLTTTGGFPLTITASATSTWKTSSGQLSLDAGGTGLLFKSGGVTFLDVEGTSGGIIQIVTGNLRFGAGVGIRSQAGAGSFDFSLATGATNFATGNLSWAGASTKTGSLVASGTFLLDGSVVNLGGTTLGNVNFNYAETANGVTPGVIANVPVGAGANNHGWLQVSVGGSVRYIPIWAAA